MSFQWFSVLEDKRTAAVLLFSEWWGSLLKKRNSRCFVSSSSSWNTVCLKQKKRKAAVRKQILVWGESTVQRKEKKQRLFLFEEWFFFSETKGSKSPRKEAPCLKNGMIRSRRGGFRCFFTRGSWDSSKNPAASFCCFLLKHRRTPRTPLVFFWFF